MLEYWYKEKPTLTDFRRGVLGQYFDGFTEYLKAKGYSQGTATGILGKCCQFNGFLIDLESQGVPRLINRTSGSSILQWLCCSSKK